MATIEVWDLWYPQAASTGLPFARGRLNATDVLLVHSAPDVLTATVRADSGELIAHSQDLSRTARTPIARLTRDGNHIQRQDIWPTSQDIGRPVLLPGGEVGILKGWWNPPDGSEWRWQVEFYNHL
jgi:hypothetical protein